MSLKTLFFITFCIYGLLGCDIKGSGQIFCQNDCVNMKICCESNKDCDIFCNDGCRTAEIVCPNNGHCYVECEEESMISIVIYSILWWFCV